MGDDVADRGHQGITDLNHELLESRFEDGYLSGLVVLHG